MQIKESHARSMNFIRVHHTFSLSEIGLDPQEPPSNIFGLSAANATQY